MERTFKRATIADLKVSEAPYWVKVTCCRLDIGILIYSTKWPYVKTMNAKNTNKSPIHENAYATITCDFGDGDISCSRSRFTHTRIASSIIVSLLEPCGRPLRSWDGHSCYRGLRRSSFVPPRRLLLVGFVFEISLVVRVSHNVLSPAYILATMPVYDPTELSRANRVATVQRPLRRLNHVHCHDKIQT